MKKLSLFISMCCTLLLSACSHNSNVPNISYETVRTSAYEITFPSTWVVRSQRVEEQTMHTTLMSTEDNSIITLSIANSYRTFVDNCNLSASNLVNKKSSILAGYPTINANVCNIRAFENNKNYGMIQKTFENEHKLYSIYYEGNISKIKPIIDSIRGSAKFMSLFADGR